MTSDEEYTQLAVLSQLEGSGQAERIRILLRILDDEALMLTKDEVLPELIRVRFNLMRINGVLQSEGRLNHVLEVAQQLIDEQVRALAPEAE